MKILGNHIRTLVFKLFLYYMPQLVLEGRVFCAVPPLYGLKNKKGEVIKYFTTRLDYTEFLMKSFSKDNQVADMKNNIIPPREISKIIYNNGDYTYQLDILRRRYALNPRFLEFTIMQLISCKGMDKNKLFKHLKKSIESEYRFMKVFMEHDVIVLDGIINYQSNSIVLTPQFYNDINNMIELIAKNDHMDFILNGTHCRMYDLMKKYESSAPGGIIRYKGLGEMNEDQLGESTLRPDGDRVLIQYNLQNEKDCIDKIKYYEADKKRLLEGTSATRTDLIG